MKYALACIKMVCVGVIVLVLLFSFSREVFAECIYFEKGPVANPPENMCESFTCGSPSGICSSGYQSYSCGYYPILGEWGCYWQYYSCDTACGGGGGGYVPNWAGYHDAYFDAQESATCRAAGWVTDLNRPDQDVLIHIYSDGAEIDSIDRDLRWASIYRSDLTGMCTGGTCAFDVDLNGHISYGVDHNILIQVGVNYWLPHSGIPPRGLGNRKINCAAPPPANTAPTGTLSCPSSPTYLGQSASFTLHGNDSDGNLSYAGLYYSLTGNQSWNTINANITCTGGSCAPTQSWTPSATGTYYVTANYFDSAGKQCSGNPFVTYPSYRNTGISFQLRMGIPDCV